MNIEEWVAEEKQRLDEFVKNWKEQQTGKNAEFYPSDMPPGEWDEQYRLWES
jgi:hypothetical protein